MSLSEDQIWEESPVLRKSLYIAVLALLFSGSWIADAAAKAQTSADEILKLAEAQQPALLETLEQLVNIDTGTGNVEGLAKVEAILVDRLSALDAEVELKPAEKFGGNNIIGSLKGAGSRKILLMCHYDKVFEPGEAGKRPFRNDGKRLYGPGVADAKGHTTRHCS